MKKVTLYIGIDVDDLYFHYAVFNRATGEITNGKTKPNVGHLIKQLERFNQKGVEIKCCYEATYCGYSLHNSLNKHGFETKLIAPSSIYRKTGKHIKTDRIDAEELATQFAKEMLRFVHVPCEEETQDRGLLRTRHFLVDQRKSLKQHILSLCRFNGLDYKLENKSKEYWTKTHINWLFGKVKSSRDELKINLDLLLKQLENLSETIQDFEDKIEALSETKQYKIKVDALCCFKGIKTLTAMTLITELGDIKRFDHPMKLTSYCGMDLREYSSGGNVKRYGITKMGNVFIRTAAIESCQMSHLYQRTGAKLKLRRKDKDPEMITIAEKCQKRLYKRANHLLEVGKNRNKVKVAVAREFLGFIWSALQKVS
jgi:transposase